jgi:hypothetical protein
MSGGRYRTPRSEQKRAAAAISNLPRLGCFWRFPSAYEGHSRAGTRPQRAATGCVLSRPFLQSTDPVLARWVASATRALLCANLHSDVREGITMTNKRMPWWRWIRDKTNESHFPVLVLGGSARTFSDRVRPYALDRRYPHGLPDVPNFMMKSGSNGYCRTHVMCAR